MLLEIISKNTEKFADIKAFIEQHHLLPGCHIFEKSNSQLHFITSITEKDAKEIKNLAIKAGLDKKSLEIHLHAIKRRKHSK